MSVLDEREYNNSVNPTSIFSTSRHRVHICIDEHMHRVTELRDSDENDIMTKIGIGR